MAVRMVPLFSAAVLGVADSFFVRSDTQNARTQIGSQWATWYEAALLLGGIALDMANAYQFAQFTEPAIHSGAALLGSRFGLWAQQQGGGASVYRGASIPAAGTPYVASGSIVSPFAAGAVHKQPTESLI